MADNTQHKTEQTEDRPEARSLDREPSAEPTPTGTGLPVDDKEDAPRGQPTSDRFETEQAHRKGGKSK